MIIKKLCVDNFKIIDHAECEFLKEINVFCGSNASGKTSFLDSIHYLSFLCTTSFYRNPSLIRDNFPQSVIKGEFLTKKGIKNRIVLISKYGHKTSADGREITKMSDFIKGVSVVTFNSDDIISITTTPQKRRATINLICCQCFSDQVIYLSNYKKIIRDKNALLKADQDFDDDLFMVLTSKQFSLIKDIEQHNYDLLNLINEKLNYYHRLLTREKETASIELNANVGRDETFEQFVDKCTKEKIYKMCLYGCQRDDYSFYINGNNIMNRASQGQIKTLAVSLKLACVDVLYSLHGEQPIVLMDDVFGELDKERQNLLLIVLRDMGNQVFITTPSISDIDEEIIGCSKVIYLKGGKIDYGHERS